MNLGKLTNIVSSVIKSRKDKTNKITQLAMAINGTYVEDTTYSPADEKPAVTAPVFDSIDLVGSSFTASHFLLGDDMVFNYTLGNELTSPNIVFFTQEQRSKTSMSAELNTDEFTQEDFALGVFDDNLTSLGASFGIGDVIPENATCFINASYLANMFVENLITSFTITYDGVDYVYNSTNILIIQDDEEPNAPTLYSAVFNSKSGVTTSEYTLGDNLVVSDENGGTSLSPAVLLLTSELAQNMSVSVATANNSSSSISPEIILNLVDSMSVKEITNFADIDISSISSFISEHNITHVVSFMGVYDYFAPSIQGTSDEVVSSFTITYNGNSYTYGFDNFTFNVGQ